MPAEPSSGINMLVNLRHCQRRMAYCVWHTAYGRSYGCWGFYNINPQLPKGYEVACQSLVGKVYWN